MDQPVTPTTKAVRHMPLDALRKLRDDEVWACIVEGLEEMRRRRERDPLLDFLYNALAPVEWPSGT